LADQGKLDEAIQHFERALQLRPDYADALNNLGFALAKQGRWDEAIQHYERTLQLRPDYAEAHCNLGIALAKQGRWDEAITQLQQALALAMVQGNTTLAKSIRTRLKSYQPALLQPQTP
jgi:tetratricopeptide (TPR) repeat protein